MYPVEKLNYFIIWNGESTKFVSLCTKGESGLYYWGRATLANFNKLVFIVVRH
jgi:hypothetical protein